MFLVRYLVIATRTITKTLVSKSCCSKNSEHRTCVILALISRQRGNYCLKIILNLSTSGILHKFLLFLQPMYIIAMIIIKICISIHFQKLFQVIIFGLYYKKLQNKCLFLFCQVINNLSSFFAISELDTLHESVIPGRKQIPLTFLSLFIEYLANICFELLISLGYLLKISGTLSGMI